MKILAIDDDKETAQLLEIYIRNEGYEPTSAYDGKEALTKLNTSPDTGLTTLGSMAPEIGGMDITKQVQEDSDIPILVFPAKTADTDKIQGLITGVDDYVTRPFNPPEIMVRAKSLLRRGRGEVINGQPDTLNIGLLLTNKDSYEVKVIKGDVIRLTALELSILYLLVSYPNRAFSVDDIFERIRQQESAVSAKTVMVYASYSRDKIGGATDGEKVIQTIWGVGYKMEGH